MFYLLVVCFLRSVLLILCIIFKLNSQLGLACRKHNSPPEQKLVVKLSGWTDKNTNMHLMSMSSCQRCGKQQNTKFISSDSSFQTTTVIIYMLHYS